jgi:D-aminopeptidase
VAKRAAVGLSRTGSYVSNGSGEIAIAFSTANPVPHYAKTEILPFRMVDDNAIDVVFRATADAVHEAVLSSLLHATTVEGRSGHVRWALGDILAKTEEKEAGEHDR